MERLTYDFCIGGNHCWQVKGADNLECREVCQRQEDKGCKDCPIAKAFDRLAAYEETGMEPEDILRILDAYGRGMTLREENAQRLEIVKDIQTDRLRELAQADREGRCVVQKFAPGSEVWIVERDEDGEAAEVSGFVFVVSVSGIAIVSPSINGCSDLDFILSDFVEETARNFSGDFSGYPISDCYKSHEEAEAALRREQDG